MVFTASRGFKIFAQTFIREYFRLQDRIKHKNIKMQQNDNRFEIFMTATYVVLISPVNVFKVLVNLVGVKVLSNSQSDIDKTW